MGIMNYTLHTGDCLDIMRGMPDNSVDTVITDTPYGLGKTPDIAEVLTHWLNDEHYDMGSGFMAKAWDVVPAPPVWKELYRIVKPGGTLLAFGGTRTADLLSISIRMGGWERFDEIAYMHGGLPPSIEWCYGSGFPKSANISKLLDKQAGAEREVVGQRDSRSDYDGKVRKSAALNTGWREKEGRTDTYDLSEKTITAPATDAAKLWTNHGTAMKPAHEPILCFRKPVEGTFAKNALAYGVAGLNIDECRVTITDGAKMARNNADGDNGWKNSSGGKNSAALNGEPAGRWPANLIHDGSAEVVAGFPVTTGGKYSGPSERLRNSFKLNPNGNTGSSDAPDNYGDTGSAARFFYSAKTSKAERTCGGKVANNHPTVKPLALIRYLARLTKTPTGGVVLDPFVGSGSTGVACVEEGRDFIGIDITPEYVEIARQRIEHANAQLELEL